MHRSVLSTLRPAVCRRLGCPCVAAVFGASPPFARRGRGAYYDSPGKSLQPLSAAIQRFKYRRRLDNGTALAELAAEHCRLAAGGYDCILPVPLHIDRLRRRGFNQSLLLARAIGERYTIRVEPFVLQRIRPTLPQTQLTQPQRRANVRGAFAVSDPEGLRGKRLLLVDDVYTSGATVEECARTLYQGGARTVDVFTLTRAVVR